MSILVRRASLSLLIAMTLGVAFAQPSGASDGERGPELEVWTTAVLYSTAYPNANTPGANYWGCEPSADHPRPVVLVHGTVENRYDNWASLAPKLKRAGYCVFALNYGNEDESLVGRFPGRYGTAPMRESAHELDAFVDKVVEATGAEQVDIVAHSQGAPLARWWMRFHGGGPLVKNFVSMGGTNHGGTASGLVDLLALAGIRNVDALVPASTDQMPGSDFLNELNAGSETEPGVTYTIIAGKYDRISTPYRATFLTAGPGATVHNVVIQDGCAIDFSGHLGQLTSPRVRQIVLNALDPENAKQLPCHLYIPLEPL